MVEGIEQAGEKGELAWYAFVSLSDVLWLIKEVGRGEENLRVHAENRKLKERHRLCRKRVARLEREYVPIVATLAIYGERADLPALVEKARALNERDGRK